MQIKELFKKTPPFSLRGDKALYEWLENVVDPNFEVETRQEAISYLAPFIDKKVGVDFIQSNETIYVPSLTKGSGISDGMVHLEGWKIKTLAYMLKELEEEG